MRGGGISEMGKGATLGTIEEEATACRARFAAAGTKIGDLVWLVHHDILCEPLGWPRWISAKSWIGSAETRIAYILLNKPETEQARRLYEFRPVLGPLPAGLSEAYARWNEASAQWNEARARRDEACARANEARARWNAACDRWDEAYARWNDACVPHLPALEAIHRSEVPGSAWDGGTIFGEDREEAENVQGPKMSGM